MPELLRWILILDFLRLYFFLRIEAAKAQIVTAGIGMVGACFALWIDAIDPDNATSLWVTKLQFGHFSPAQLVLFCPKINCVKYFLITLDCTGYSF